MSERLTAPVLLGSLAGNLTGRSCDDGTAFRLPGAELSREALLAAASVVGQRFTGAAAVAVDATASAQTVIAIVGCLLAGVPVVPIPPDSGPSEREHILRDSGAEIVLGTADIDVGARSSFTLPEPAPDATALILYTSGTTGPPKGVLLSRAAIAAGLDALADAWAWTPDDTLAHGLPLFHVHGLVLGVLGPLRLGGRLIHTGRPSPERYAEAAGQGASMFFGVPTVWSRVGGSPAAAATLSRARLLVSGSAPLPVSVFEQLADLTGHRPIERYGMTETLITLSTRADGERRPGIVGAPLAGVTTRLGEDDELQLRSPALFSGYLNRPDATAASFTADGWFRTGDVAQIGPDGAHRIVGRASIDLIKSGGYRIGAGEVEDALLSHPSVLEAAVVGLPDADLGQSVTAFVVTDGGAGVVAETALIDHVAQRLSVHKRPRRVVFVPELPRNPMGKVLKTELRGPRP